MFDLPMLAGGLVGISLILWGLKRRVDSLICLAFAIIFTFIALS